jgi:hypothetical protein
MATQWRRDLFGYEAVEGRQVVAAFDGGEVMVGSRPRSSTASKRW